MSFPRPYRSTKYSTSSSTSWSAGRRDDDRDVLLDDDDRVGGQLLGACRVVAVDEAEIDQSVDVLVGRRFREIERLHSFRWGDRAPVADVDVDAGECWAVEQFHDCFEPGRVLGQRLRLERVFGEDVDWWRVQRVDSTIWANVLVIRSHMS